MRGWEGFGGLRNLGWAGRWGREGNGVGELRVRLLGWMDVTNLALCHYKFMSLLLSKLASRRSSLTASPTGCLNTRPLPKIARHFQHHQTPQAVFISHSCLDIPIKSDPDLFDQQIKSQPVPP